MLPATDKDHETTEALQVHWMHKQGEMLANQCWTGEKSRCLSHAGGESSKPHPLIPAKHRSNSPASFQMLFLVIMLFLCSLQWFSLQSLSNVLTFWCSLTIKSFGVFFKKKVKLPVVSRTLRGQPVLHWVYCVPSLQTVLQRGQYSSPRTPDG